jgi:hypothetical protein
MLTGIALSLALQATAAAPPPLPQQQEGDQAIVVNGRRDVERQIHDFVKALTDVPPAGQISRFDWAVCPAAIGLSKRQDDEVADRMRAVASAVGMRVDKPGCRANVLVVVARNAQNFVDWLRDNEPEYFTGVPPKEKQALKHVGAAAAWHIEGRVDQDGVNVSRDSDTGMYISSRTDVPSRISTNTHPAFDKAMVVLDGRSLAGLTVVQLADYAAMRAFAKTDPSRLAAPAAPTILTILDTPIGRPVPITLTEWDLAYLKALYGSTENRLAGQQSGEMAHKMAHDLKDRPDRN